MQENPIPKAQNINRISWMQLQLEIFESKTKNSVPNKPYFVKKKKKKKTVTEYFYNHF